MQTQLFDWAKTQGVSFVILCIVIYVLFSRLETTEKQMDTKLEKMEQKIDQCNAANQAILINQVNASREAIEQSNRWHEMRSNR